VGFSWFILKRAEVDCPLLWLDAWDYLRDALMLITHQQCLPGDEPMALLSVSSICMALAQMLTNPSISESFQHPQFIILRVHFSSAVHSLISVDHQFVHGIETSVGKRVSLVQVIHLIYHHVKKGSGKRRITSSKPSTPLSPSFHRAA
jgi:hypothetical protein